MGMDNDGLLFRRRAMLSVPTLDAALLPRERTNAFATLEGKLRWKPGLKSEEREHYQRRAFLRLGYDDQIKHCLRVDELDGPPESAWPTINAHLGTSAMSLPELVRMALLVDFGTRSSPRLLPPHGPLAPGGRNGRSSQAVDPAQDRGEQGARYRHLGQPVHALPAEDGAHGGIAGDTLGVVTSSSPASRP